MKDIWADTSLHLLLLKSFRRPKCLFVITKYSLLNSCSRTERRRSSQLSSKAVRMGSLLERAIRDGLANAR